jgi:hypothetical protein
MKIRFMKKMVGGNLAGLTIEDTITHVSLASFIRWKYLVGKNCKDWTYVKTLSIELSEGPTTICM